MVNIQNLTFRYSRRKPPVLDDFSLEIKPGTINGLLGPNGAGKSTLLYLIMGALTPGVGQVTVNGINTRRRNPSLMADMFLVPEEFALPPVSLRSYLRLNAPLYPRFSYDDMASHLALFGFNDLDINLGALSMGQKKKVFMCFALSCNTRLLLMDEPTNGLDIPGKSVFRRFISESMTDERTVLISTHQVRDIDKLLDNVIIMNSNKLLLDASVADVQRRLKFTVTNDAREIKHSIYMMPGLQGASVIMLNEDGEETDVNLESLFDFVLRNPDKAHVIFNE